MKATPQHWKRLFALFDQYMELEAGARPGWLEALAHSDPGIERDMLKLLERHGQLAGADFLHLPAWPPASGPKPPGRFVLKSVATGAETELSRVMVAGRLPESDVRLAPAGPPGGPSRRHARFSVIDNEVWLEDLASKNGTFVNGRRIASPTVLRSGDSVRFDVEEFAFRIERPRRPRRGQLLRTDGPREAAAPEVPIRETHGATPGSRATDRFRALFRSRK